MENSQIILLLSVVLEKMRVWVWLKCKDLHRILLEVKFSSPKKTLIYYECVRFLSWLLIQKENKNSYI